MSYNQVDALRPTRNMYYLGQYAACAAEVAALPPNTPYAEVFKYRALAEVNPQAVDAAIAASAPVALQAVKLYVSYKAHYANAPVRAQIVATMEQWLQDVDFARDETLQIIAATVFVCEGNYKEALKIASADAEDNLEKLALQTQVLLAIQRPDLAAAPVARMQAVDDDDALSQLALAWLSLANKDAKSLADAVAALTELNEKFPAAPRVLATLGGALVLQGKAREGFAALRQAREAGAAAGAGGVSLETLVNSAVCLFHRGTMLPAAEAVFEKVWADLRQQFPNAAIVQAADQAAAEFDKAAARYQ